MTQKPLWSRHNPDCHGRALPLLGILLLVAGGVSGSSPAPGPERVAASASVQGTESRQATALLPTDDASIVHLLNRATFGQRPEDMARVRQAGVAAWIDEQLDPARISDTAMDARLAGLETLNMDTDQLSREYFLPAQMERRQLQQQRGQEDPAVPGAGAGTAPPSSGTGIAPGSPRNTTRPGQAGQGQPGARPASPAMEKERRVLAQLTEQKLLRAIYSERQLQEVMVDFWFNHFNVFAGKGQTRLFLTSYERDTIRPYALGRFRDLLGATAKSPAMLFYLDNWMSSDPKASPAGAAGRDTAQVRPGMGRGAAGRGGFTGTQPGRGQTPYAPAQRPQMPRRGLNENYARELMELHTLGVDGGYTQQDVTEVARAFTGWTLQRPQTGGGYRFDERLHDKGTKRVLGQEIKAGGERDGAAVLDLLARHSSTARFIASKLARRFVSDEPPPALVERAAARFRETDGDIREVVRTILTSPEFFAPDARRAKVKTPQEFVVSALRASRATVSDVRPIVAALRDLGMPPYFCQPPTGYADTADAWVNTGSLISRMNFAMQLVSARGRGVQVDVGQLTMTPSGEPGYESLASRLLGAPMSDATRTQVGKAQTPQQATALLLGSPEFQKR